MKHILRFQITDLGKVLTNIFWVINTIIYFVHKLKQCGVLHISRRNSKFLNVRYN